MGGNVAIKAVSYDAGPRWKYQKVLFPLAIYKTMSYYWTMEIRVDPFKDAVNIKERGLPLELATVLLNGATVLKVDDRFDYGETRIVALGEIAGRVHVCVYTMRGEIYRVISLRKANRRETNVYRKSYPRSGE